MGLLTGHINVCIFPLLLMCAISTVSSVELGEDTAIDAKGVAWINSLFYLPEEVRVRKEYRLLSREERNNLHTAVVKLKQDKSVEPNKYDLLASLHARTSSRNAGHKGTGFLPWHRVYTLLAENALREMVPNVTMAYWDITLDATLEEPRYSSLWSEDFMGNGDGFVVTGSFKSWSTVTGSLFRTVASDGGLFTDVNITRMLTYTHLGDISLPNTQYKHFEDIFEETHNQAHKWVGGEMRLIETAAEDPVFFIYHGFVDCIWEMFRSNQRANGVDPETDWDLYYGQARHHKYSPMGLGGLMSSDGASEVFAENIRYEPRPTCTRQQTDCQSLLLYCNIVQEKCTPWTIKEYNNIKQKAEMRFMPFEFEAEKAIREKIQEGFVELNKPKVTTEAATTSKPTVDNHIDDDDGDDEHNHHHHHHHHTVDSSSEDVGKIDEIHGHNHSHHHHDHALHAGNWPTSLKQYLPLVILAALLVLRVLLCVCCKCCSRETVTVKVKRRSKKYKFNGIVNVNYKDDNNKTETRRESTPSRPDNIYTITETCPDTSTLGHSAYVRFSRYVIGGDKNADDNTDDNTDESETHAGNNSEVNDPTDLSHFHHKYIKNTNKGAGRRNRDKESCASSSTSEAGTSSNINNETHRNPADDYMDMNYATQISQSESYTTQNSQSEGDVIEIGQSQRYAAQISQSGSYSTQISQQEAADVFEKESNASDLDDFADYDSENRMNSIENENFELPVETTENSFAFLDDYDNIDFIREAICQDRLMQEELYTADFTDDSSADFSRSEQTSI